METIIKIGKRDHPYVTIDTRPLLNKALSWRAKGVLVYLISRPPDWVTRIGDLMKQSPTSRGVIQSVMRELVKAGHARLESVRDKRGKLGGKVWVISELPRTDSPDFRLSGKTDRRENDLLLSNDTLHIIDKVVLPVWSKKDGWQNIDAAWKAELAAAYPACNIDRQLLAMTQWLKANPKRANKSNWRRFIINWLMTQQDRGGDQRSYGKTTQATTPRRVDRNIGTLNAGKADLYKDAGTAEWLQKRRERRLREDAAREDEK